MRVAYRASSSRTECPSHRLHLWSRRHADAARGAGHELISVEDQDPITRRPGKRKRSCRICIPDPFVREYPRTEFLGDLDGLVVAMRVNDDDLVDPILD